MSALLQELLNLGLVDIDDSDERLNHLEKASEDLTEHLAKTVSHTIPFVLVAIDDSVPEDDPVFEQAEQAVMQHWRLLRRRFTERPRALLRFVLLDALHRAAQASDRVCAAAAFTSHATLGRLALGQEENVVRRLSRDWATRVETAAAAAWATESTLPNSPQVPTDPPKVTVVSPSFTADQFRPAIERAPGPTNGQNQAIPGANPHWPGANHPWAFEFSTRMADAFAGAANAVAQELATASSQALATQASALSSALVEPLVQFANDLAVWLAARQRAAFTRLDLLWWKEALYSPSARMGYRQLSPSVAALLMAEDVLTRVPTPTPEAVAAYLRETVNLLVDSPTAPRRLSEWIAELRDGSAARNVILLPKNRTGRVPLGDILRMALHAQASENDVRSRTGRDPDLKLTLAELATWFFYDRQAERVAAGA